MLSSSNLARGWGGLARECNSYLWTVCKLNRWKCLRWDRMQDIGRWDAGRDKFGITCVCLFPDFHSTLAFKTEKNLFCAGWCGTGVRTVAPEGCGEAGQAATAYRNPCRHGPNHVTCIGCITEMVLLNAGNCPWVPHLLQHRGYAVFGLRFGGHAMQVLQEPNSEVFYL
jgi:hypothetical protein